MMPIRRHQRKPENYGVSAWDGEPQLIFPPVLKSDHTMLVVQGRHHHERLAPFAGATSRQPRLFSKALPESAGFFVAGRTPQNRLETVRGAYPVLTRQPEPIGRNSARY